MCLFHHGCTVSISSSGWEFHSGLTSNRPFLHRQWPGISGCCRSYLEQSTTTHHLDDLSTSLQSTSEDLPLLTVLIPGTVYRSTPSWHPLYQSWEHVWTPTSSQCPCTWNSLPQHTILTSSLPVLRARLNTYLFSLSLYLEQSTSTHHLDVLSTSLESTSEDLPLLTVLIPGTVYRSTPSWHPLYQSWEHVWRPTSSHCPSEPILRIF